MIGDHDTEDCKAKLNLIYDQLQQSCNSSGINIIVGTITQENGRFYNTALLFSPFGERQHYHKRALWGWDKDNFEPGNDDGIFLVGDWKIGIRICFEIRFPEYFRELYKKQTDLNIVLFYDVNDNNDSSRYEILLVYDLEKKKMDFGEKGRKEISDLLLSGS